MMTGIELIEQERFRQVDQEGYGAAHDDSHTDKSIAIAAEKLLQVYLDTLYQPGVGGTFWPCLLANKYGWHPSRPKKPDIETLAAAGALIAAEIDRLQRAEILNPTRKATP
jgi:hypothetical protein